MPWEKSWGVTNGAGVLKVRFPPTAYYMMQVGAAAAVLFCIAVAEGDGGPRRARSSCRTAAFPCF